MLFDESPCPEYNANSENAKSMIQVAVDIVSQDCIRQEAPKLLMDMYERKVTEGEFYGFFVGLLRSAKTPSQVLAVSWLMDEFLPDSIKGKMMERLMMEEIAMASSTKLDTLLGPVLARVDRMKKLGRIKKDFAS